MSGGQAETGKHSFRRWRPGVYQAHGETLPFGDRTLKGRLQTTFLTAVANAAA